MRVDVIMVLEWRSLGACVVSAARKYMRSSYGSIVQESGNIKGYNLSILVHLSGYQIDYSHLPKINSFSMLLRFAE